MRGDGYRLPFADATFDCVVASEVLEHLTRDDEALAEIRRVLKPGGQIAVSVPRWGPEVLCWALSDAYYQAEGGHVRIYGRQELRRKLGAHGFRVVAGHFAHALHAPYWWLRCLLGLEDGRGGLVGLYRRMLEWDMLEQPSITRALERALNPVLGKSEVLYAHLAPGDAARPVGP